MNELDNTIKYWLCCGSRDPSHSDTRANKCMEAKIGHPERCRFGTAKEHSLWQLKDYIDNRKWQDFSSAIT